LIPQPKSGGAKEAWSAADRLREKIAKVSGNFTADIREWRDNVDAHR
jgi:hypothetical protein